ncbi:uncharacterized protein [Zea mays]|uniref:DUF3741 domain-containing protein n=1 Tax=Zea mays TaxID=4577 RepID=A0A804QJU3_MAIZE|nr:uncharacterized protein LOC103635295 isoform X1 [Zea mays]|eukprot:XP_008656008.1 uncharacterized protein LOC103635295 isoform X1 [Zea mays]
MKSGTASAPSGGGGGLAITERQKPAPSRVAALFQMFAKRKLFSSSSKKSKLLPPVRAHKFSPGRPLAGGDKTRPLLIDSADYSRSRTECNGTSHYPQPQPGQDRNCSENGMRAPGVVARLMGLSSMPAAASHQRQTRATTNSPEPGDHWNSGRQDRSGSSRGIYTSPQQQQQQKTRQQPVDDRHHGNAGQFSAPDTRPLWPRRHAHRAASPVKSPRSLSSRNRARLIEAAVRVLEPGLQSRNRRLSKRHAYLEYPCSNGDGAPSSAAAAAVRHNVSDQFLRNICDADIPASGAHNLGAASLHNSISNRRTEEDTCKKSIPPSRRSDQSTSCQLQPEYLLIGSTEKAAGFADTNQDAPREQLKSNISRDSAPRGPLKQNNLKQNALPAADPGCVIQSKKHGSGERNVRNRTQDFVSLNKRMDGSASLRSKRKALDRFGEPRCSAEDRNMMSTKGCRASSLHGGTSNKLELRTGTPKAMVTAKGAGLISEKPKPASPNRARSGLQRQTVPHNVSRANKEPGTISLTSGSPVKAARGDSASGTGAGTAVQVDSCPERRSRRDCQKTCPQGEIVFWEDLKRTSNPSHTEPGFSSQDEVKNRVILGGTAASSLSGKKSGGQVTEESLSEGLLRQRNSLDCAVYDNKDPYEVASLRGTRKKKHAAGAKGSKPSPSPCISSPTSTPHSGHAGDACVPGIPRRTAAEATSTTSHPWQDTAAERNPRGGDPNNSGQHGVQFQTSEPHAGEATITTSVELLLANVRASTTPRKPEESPKAFLLRTTERALAALTAGSKQGFGSTAIEGKGASPLRNLALDCVWDCLDSTCSRLCDSGYRSFSELLALVCTEKRLADRVGKEVARCCGAAGKGLDELAVGEVERAVEAGMGSSMLEAVQIGAQIEQDLVQDLIDEIGADVFRRW